MSASRVLVYGGRGALGSAVVDFFKSKSWVRLHGGMHEPDSYILFASEALYNQSCLSIVG